MKKVVILMVICALLISLCSCSSHVGDVSQSGDPMIYFVSDNSWTTDEIEQHFGAFSASEMGQMFTFEHMEYRAEDVRVFGESWDLEIIEYGDPYGITGGSFIFEQNDVGEKAFVAYRDEIVKHYTKLYGEPEEMYESSDTPAWAWKTSGVSIYLQDCRPVNGTMAITFAPAK